MITSLRRRKSWPSLPPPTVMMTMMLMSMMNMALCDIDIDANDGAHKGWWNELIIQRSLFYDKMVGKVTSDNPEFALLKTCYCEFCINLPMKMLLSVSSSIQTRYLSKILHYKIFRLQISQKMRNLRHFFLRIKCVNASNINNLGIFWLWMN